MAKITKQELLKIARISHLDIHDEEIDMVLAQLESVLSYAERVKEMAVMAADEEISSNKMINVFREDLVVSFDAQAVLALAPEQEEDFFVVPKVLDNNM